MAYDNDRYERIYSELLSWYPPQFRERVGESMEQTFRDLCNERRSAGQSLFSFALWTYFDTAQAIIREEKKHMRTFVIRRLLMTFVLVFTIAILTGTYVMNGSEREDAWLYIMSGIIALSVIIPEYFKKKDEK